MTTNKPILVLLHGMGKHTAESFKQEVITGANNALQRYPSYKNTYFEDYVQIESIAYDPIIEDIRDRIASSNKSVTQYLKAEELDDNISILIEKISGFEENLQGDNFLNTHCLDVILYLTILGERIRIHVAKELTRIMLQNPIIPINVLAHSLGTSVLHDTLFKLYQNDHESSDNFPNLTLENHKLNSIWMVSNVSRILADLSINRDPYKTIVKPGSNGCTSRFFNCRHKLDPFTWINKFNPQKSDGWIDRNIYDSNYKNIVTHSISRVNTHDICGYIEDPKICFYFLNQFMEFNPPLEEWMQGEETFKTIQGMYGNIKDKLDNFHYLSNHNLVNFLKLLFHFEIIIQGIMEHSEYEH